MNSSMQDDYNATSEDDPTLFSLSGIQLDIISNHSVVEEALARVLQPHWNSSVSVSVVDQDDEERRILFMVYPAEEDEERIIEIIQDRIADFQKPSSKGSAPWLDSKEAFVSKADMEEEVLISEEMAYDIWLNDGNDNGNDRTCNLSLVRSPDGKLVRPRHHNSNHEEESEEQQKAFSPIQSQLQRDPTLLEFDNVPRIPIKEFLSSDSALSCQEPVVLVGIMENDDTFLEYQHSMSLQNLVDRFGDAVVRTGNRETLIENGFHHSEPKTLKEALLLPANNNNGHSEESGRMVFSPLQELPEGFQNDIMGISPDKHNLFHKVLAGPKFTLCLAKEGFGIGMHKHGPAMFFLIEGRKKWYLSPPGPIDRDMQQGVSTHPEFYTKKSSHKCLQQPGEILFVPDQWYHEIFNLEYTAGIQALADTIQSNTIQ